MERQKILNLLNEESNSKFVEAKDLDLVMPIYNLIYNSSNYFETKKVYGFILKMKQLILMQISPITIMTIISNLSTIKPHYWETQF